MATFVMFTSANSAQEPIVINIEQITTIVPWGNADVTTARTRIYTSGGEYAYVTEDFNRVIDKIRGEK